MMENTKYEIEANKTIPNVNQYKEIEFSLKDKKIINACLGLSGEVGELVDIFKKFYFQGHSLNELEIKKELGDIFWYLNLICQSMDTSFSEVFDLNIEKLRKRYGEKFDSQKSVNREEYQN